MKQPRKYYVITPDKRVATIVLVGYAKSKLKEGDILMRKLPKELKK